MPIVPYDSQAVAAPFRKLCPTGTIARIWEIDPQELAKRGKKLVLLDVDNTLVLWRSHDIPAETTAWIESAKGAGLQLCILSNTKNPGRLKELADQMGVPYIRGRFKPSRQMYLQALEQFRVKAGEAIMIGDQLFTDILGANRTGIEAIWVEQMGQREFAGTKISRLGERIVRPWLRRGMMEEVKVEGSDEIAEDLHVGGTAAFDLMSHPTVRQFIKFVIVGATSTVIDAGLHYLLLWVIPSGGGLLSDRFGQWLLGLAPDLFTGIATKDGAILPSLAASPIFKVISAGLAIFNSFVWNRAWTFRIQGKEHRTVQLGKFYVIAIVGLILNTVIVTMLGNTVPGHAKRSWAVATIIATIVVAFWNFFGQKLWTFRKH